MPNTQFVGPGNRVVDENNHSNFNSLLNNCLDWVALEHDVAYHNLSESGNTKLYQVEVEDDKAIDNAWRECRTQQPVGTAVLIGGLKTKQHFERLAESISWPFGNNNAIYPRPISNIQHINWFDQMKSRRRILGKYGFSIFRALSSNT